MNTLKVLIDYIKLSVCHDIYNAIQVDSHSNEDIKVNLLSLGELIIKCDPVTTELSYSLEVSKSFDKMIKDIYDRNYSPLTNKIEESVVKIFSEKFDNLGIEIDEEDDE